MKAIILYDSKSQGGSTDRLVDAIGVKLAEAGHYVEKARCKSNGDYSFVKEFDMVIMGSPIYYLMVSTELLGSMFQSNLKSCVEGKQIGLFLLCGSPEIMGNLLYLPQLKLHLLGQSLVAEKIFAPDQASNPEAISAYANKLLAALKNH
uniref:Protochlorophyllide oxidoreductase n=1 Tax=Chlorobium chlorochromatii (strain CaD3) TaxID=340177 RepID=Q3AQP6_CHLCH